MSLPNPQTTFRCVYADRDADGEVVPRYGELPLDRLPAGDVTVRVAWSSLNYKDALAATGYAGVAGPLPHVPGIDAAGAVLESSSPHFQPGQEVIVTGYELGAPRWGGWAEVIRVPAEWVAPQPAGLSQREAMQLGTAGFTAAQCVAALQHNDVRAAEGEVVVTGASGGVGILAVALLAKLGYRVVASSGKAAAEPLLRELGAARVVGRQEVVDDSSRPLLKSRWIGAVDTVGGATLASLLRSTDTHGCVAACGLVGGVDLPLTVHPFILRGVTLAGITSAWCPMNRRLEIWRKLANEWRLENLDRVSREVTLEGGVDEVKKILAGEILGRVVVRVT